MHRRPKAGEIYEIGSSLGGDEAPPDALWNQARLADGGFGSETELGASDFRNRLLATGSWQATYG